MTLIQHLFSFLQDALSYPGKACLRFSYMPFRIPIRAFPHAWKAFFVQQKKAYILMMCAICWYSAAYVCAKNSAYCCADWFRFDYSRFSATLHCLHFHIFSNILLLEVSDVYVRLSGRLCPYPGLFHAAHLAFIHTYVSLVKRSDGMRQWARKQSEAVWPAKFKPESVIILPFLFRAAVSRIISCFIEDVAGYTGKKQDTRWRQQCGRRMRSWQ